MCVCRQLGSRVGVVAWLMMVFRRLHVHFCLNTFMIPFFFLFLTTLIGQYLFLGFYLFLFFLRPSAMSRDNLMESTCHRCCHHAGLPPLPPWPPDQASHCHMIRSGRGRPSHWRSKGPTCFSSMRYSCLKKLVFGYWPCATFCRAAQNYISSRSPTPSFLVEPFLRASCTSHPVPLHLFACCRCPSPFLHLRIPACSAFFVFKTRQVACV